MHLHSLHYLLDCRKVIHEYLDVEIPHVCHIPYSSATKENYVSDVVLKRALEPSIDRPFLLTTQVILELALRLGKDEEPGSSVNLKLEAFPTGDPTSAVAAEFDPAPTLGHLAFTAKEANDQDLGIEVPIYPEEVELQAHFNDPPLQFLTGVSFSVCFLGYRY